MRKYLVLIITLVFTGLGQAQPNHVLIVQQNAPAVVAVNVLTQKGGTLTATGFVLTPDGLIATNRHVCENALYINITFSNGAVSGEAKTVAVSKEVDLALLKIDARQLPTVTVESSAPVLPGEGITVIGNPRRLQNTVSAGIISQVRQTSSGLLWHQISAPVSPSSSGSPVFNEKGNVISVVFASFPGENNQNLNFSVPSDYLIRLVQNAGYQLPDAKAATAQLPQTSGNFFVQHVKRCWTILKQLINRLVH
ncbi:MAG: S1C family serine protease [Elusimicrobiaceae bacterium]|nr:S1C family serine protease [Elusimicrobiaceae bacterium]